MRGGDDNSSKKVSQMFGDELLSISTRLIAINQVVLVVVVVVVVVAIVAAAAAAATAANESLAGDRRGGRGKGGKERVEPRANWTTFKT